MGRADVVGGRRSARLAERCSIRARSGPLVERFHDRTGAAELLEDASDLRWPNRCLNYGGAFDLIPFSGGILAHRVGDDDTFGALRPGGIAVMVGDLLRGPHR